MPVAASAPAPDGRAWVVFGTTQGVGFRPWVYEQAQALGLTGRVRNARRGVVVEAFGASRALDELERRLRAPDLPAACVDGVEGRPLHGLAPDDFRITAGEAATTDGEEAAGPASRPCLSPDLALCPACRAEIEDPEDRRFGYAFTSCTRCGPRFTLARALPWERERTSMAAFPLCADCRREYERPGQRRFHAETNACPACGPRLVLRDARGAALAPGADAIAETARRLRDGWIVAVHGIGGFHLACDAANEDSVAALRVRKGRDRKPFAVMARDAQVSALARVDGAEWALLRSPAAPIVLLPRRPDARVARAVAPGTSLLGLMLPYSPLHALLAAAAGMPLVMTSGNRSGEPIAYRVDDALTRLGGVADAFLVHDREIEAPCDDSVAAVIAGAPVVLRRSRGHVPRPLPVARPLAAPVLGCGGHWGNTACLGVGRALHLSAHNGDLETVDSLERFEQAVDGLERLAGCRPEVLAHDLHPHYAATRWAQERAGREPLETVAVQHHHAHVAAVLAEHGHEGPVLGVAYDGTGLGPDGHAWGGELLRADRAGFERLATLRALRLAGGDVAIRQVWRLALALLDDAFEGAPPLDAFPLFAEVPVDRRDAVHDLLRRDVRCARAHGLGRLFDAFGALWLGRAEADFQGEVAMAWNQAADADGAGPHAGYPFDVDTSGKPAVLDWRPTVRAAVADHLGGAAPGQVAARFHATVAAATAALVARFQSASDVLPVALAGGCFQNGLLVREIAARLPAGTRVLRARRLPPGDGGLCVGQAVVADAMLRGATARRVG